MTRDEKDEQIWLYAAGALSDAEMQTVRALLDSGDPEDLASLQAARETIARLPESLDQAAPSPLVLSRLMERVGGKSTAMGESPTHPRLAIPPTGRLRPIIRRRSWPLMLGTAAAAGIAVFASVTALNYKSQFEDSQKQLDQSLAALNDKRTEGEREIRAIKAESEKLQAEFAKRTQELEAFRKQAAAEIASLKSNTEELRTVSLARAQELESSRAQAAKEIESLKGQMEAQKIAVAKQVDELVAQSRLLYAPNLQFTSLERQEKEIPKGGGRVLWDKDGRKANVFVFDLVPPPDGKVYELWFIEPDKAPVPAGTFTVDAKGNGQIVSPIPPGMDMDKIALAAITLEPAGGSLTPTMPIKLAGKVQ